MTQSKADMPVRVNTSHVSGGLSGDYRSEDSQRGVVPVDNTSILYRRDFTRLLQLLEEGYWHVALEKGRASKGHVSQWRQGGSKVAFGIVMYPTI